MLQHCHALVLDITNENELNVYKVYVYPLQQFLDMLTEIFQRNDEYLLLYPV